MCRCDGVRTCKVKEWTKMDGVVCLAVGVSWDWSDGWASWSFWKIPFLRFRASIERLTCRQLIMEFCML